MYMPTSNVLSEAVSRIVMREYSTTSTRIEQHSDSTRQSAGA